jgi:hypothetical protein
MNDQYNSQTIPNNSLFQNNQEPPPPVTLFEEPPQSAGNTGYTQHAMPPVYQRKPFPFFHISVLAVILGVGGWFWFSGKLSIDASGVSGKESASDFPELSETEISVYPDQIQESFQLPVKTDLASVPVSVPEAQVLPEVVPDPEPAEDPATKLFGVVSRIRSSRTNP